MPKLNKMEIYLIWDVIKEFNIWFNYPHVENGQCIHCGMRFSPIMGFQCKCTHGIGHLNSTDEVRKFLCFLRNKLKSFSLNELQELHRTLTILPDIRSTANQDTWQVDYLLSAEVNQEINNRISNTASY